MKSIVFFNNTKRVVTVIAGLLFLLTLVQCKKDKENNELFEVTSDAIEYIEENIQTQLDQLGDKTTEETMVALAEWMKAQEGVSTTEVIDDGVRIVYADGTKGSIRFYDQTLQIEPGFDSLYATSPIKIMEGNPVGKKEAFIFDAFPNLDPNINEGDEIHKLFREQGCRVRHPEGLACTIDNLNEMFQYGYVHIISHGNDDEIATREIVNRGKRELYKESLENDLLRMESLVVRPLFGGEYAWYGDFFVVTDKYIKGLEGRFDNAIVFNGSCKGFVANSPLKDAFLEKGAGAYLGFSESVSSEISCRVSKSIVSDLLRGYSIGVAYDNYCAVKPQCVEFGDTDPNTGQWVTSFTSCIEIAGSRTVTWHDAPISPTVTTHEVQPSSIGSTKATVTGSVVFPDPNQPVEYERGFIYYTMPDGSDAQQVVYPGPELLDFSCTLTGLSSNTKYYVMAYSRWESNQVFCGNEVSFTTLNGSEPWNGGGDGTVLLDYDFNTYQAGAKIAQTIGGPWTTWSGTSGGTDDGVFEVKGGSMTCHFTYGNDQVVELGNYITGVYDLVFDIFVPNGKNGYCTLLHYFGGVNSVWAVQMYLHATNDGNNTTHNPGHGTVHAGSNNTCDLPCVYDEWMHFRIHVDADNDIAQLFFNNQQMCEWRWSTDSFGNTITHRALGAMDFYPPLDAASSDFYFDNIKLIKSSSGGNHEYEYVDLGLPSGTLWATCNVGANAPEEYGGYYAWGETLYKRYYYWDTYRYCKGSMNTLTKYCDNPEYGYSGFTDDLTYLQPCDDAATANWGNDWRMPTFEEWKELYYNTTSTWTTRNGVNGRLFTASNGNTLFLPAAGSRIGHEIFDEGTECCYWTPSLNTSWGHPYKANGALFHPDFASLNAEREDGFSIRPVRSMPQK